MVTAELEIRGPFDWPAMLHYLAPRAVPGIERVVASEYHRTLRVTNASGYVSVRGLTAVLSPSLAGERNEVVARLRTFFDADADIAQISRALSADPLMARLVQRRPGLRVAGAVDRFELALRAVLGQQISVRGASTLSGRLVALFGEPLADAPSGLTHLSVRPESLAEASVEQVARIGLPRARAATIIALARAAVADRINTSAQLREIPGIGDWTAEYVAMRALRDADAFPYADIGLRKAAGRLTPKQLRERAERWRPWRAYAAMHLWASLSDD